jgi:hypothetical protein
MLPLLAREADSHDPVEHPDPEEEPDREQDLPEAAEVEVLESLVPEPVPAGVDPTVNRGQLADHAAEDDERERTQQAEGEPVLPPRLAARDHRGEEDSSGEERGRDPENRQLQVPGAHQVVGEPLRQVDAEKVGQLGAVVLRGCADEDLDEEERSHYEEEPRGRPLRGRQRNFAGRAEGECRLLAPAPAEEVPAPEGGKEQPDPAQQRDQREQAPEDHVRARLVVDQSLGRPAVRVRVVVARPARGSRPRRPAEERRQVMDLVGVVDRPRS